MWKFVCKIFPSLFPCVVVSLDKKKYHLLSILNILHIQGSDDDTFKDIIHYEFQQIRHCIKYREINYPIFCE